MFRIRTAEISKLTTACVVAIYILNMMLVSYCQWVCFSFVSFNTGTYIYLSKHTLKMHIHRVQFVVEYEAVLS